MAGLQKLQFPHRKTPALSHRIDTNMFIRPSTILFSVIALAGVATALPSDLEARNGGSNTCNSGSVQCCQSVQSSYSYQVIELFGYLGIPLPAGGTQVGLTCSPVTLGGTSTGSICTQQTVCCTGNSFYGVSTACSPININL
ncbi:hydrophobin [Boletus edulis BED1]|uniref:Hydrophobin n=2 Tax=Boletus edulis BED1 TaxID=1328754 RepID=A0AAD4BBN2_BOLED|nr:hydrophobin [Boletus edulis BED1]